MATGYDHGYSTLEAAPVAVQENQKEVANRSWENLPQAVDPESAAAKPPYYYQEPYQTNNEIPSGYTSADGITTVGKAPRKRCGVTIKTLWIIVGVVTFGIIAAVVGGVVGGVLASRSAKDSSGSGEEAPGPSQNSSSSTPATTTLLSTSKLAAVNWTDTDHFSHYAVFSQDDTDALVVSMWDSRGQTWSAVNITDRMAKGGNPVKAKSGTPLAAVSIAATSSSSFQITLYFLTPSNIISEVYCKDVNGLTWGLGQLPESSPKTADDDSSLASIWHRCDSGCPNDIYVTYVSNNVVHLLNSSDWSESESLVSVDAGSPLTVFPFVGPLEESGPNPTELRLYFTQHGDVQEYKLSQDKVWDYGFTINQSGAVDQLPQLSGAPFDGWMQILLLQLSSEGVLTGHRWDSSDWSSNQQINLKRGPSDPKFTAIAQHHEGRLYGVVDGAVHEYRWDKSDPYSMLYVGEVDIATDS